MKLTNKHNLPACLVDALSYEGYDLSESPDNILSVTSIIDSPTVGQLKRRHWGELESDVVDNCWKLFGGSVHSYLDAMVRFKGRSEVLTEERWYLDITLLKQGKIDIITLPYRKYLWKDEPRYDKSHIYLSGKFDLYDGEYKSLDDYKVTSAWTVVFGEGEAKDEWESQNNIYAYVVRSLGFEVNSQRIILILRDFDKKKGFENPNYPKIPFHVYNVNAWTAEKTLAFIIDRCDKHVQAKAIPDALLPSCSEAERWFRPGKYAIYKGTNIKAAKLCLSVDEAKQWCLANPGKVQYRIEHRPDVNTRCEEYCDVSAFCKFGRSLKKAHEDPVTEY